MELNYFWCGQLLLNKSLKEYNIFFWILRNLHKKSLVQIYYN